MASQESIIQAISQKAAAGKLTVFCGAGISMLPPSNSPSWWQIYQLTANAFLQKFRKGFPDYKQEIDMEQLLKPFATQQIADIVVNRLAGAEFVDVLRAVDVADPNENHVCLAALAAPRLLACIITTNFDTMLERSAAVTGKDYEVIVPWQPARQASPLGTPLIKLHGSAADGSGLLESFSDKAREICPAMRSHWQKEIPGTDLLVVGFSGGDLQFGAVKLFFQDFLKTGRTIWWLHRKHSLPTLSAELSDTVKLVEGDLPFLLRELVSNNGLQRFEMPVYGKDPQRELRQAIKNLVTKRSGRWTAAQFLLFLVTEHDFTIWPENRQLYDFLMSLGRRYEKLQAGAKANASEAYRFCGFLTEAGLQALKTGETALAEEMFGATYRINYTVHKLLYRDQAAHKSNTIGKSFVALSLAAGNYAIALFQNGKRNAGVSEYYSSMKFAYRGRNNGHLLLSLAGVLQYDFSGHPIRDHIPLVENCIILADKQGDVRSAVNFRLQLAAYHFTRNEPWLADGILAEAEWRANAIGDLANVCLIQLLQGAVWLKQGRYETGLQRLAAVKNAGWNGPSIFGSLVRRYLETLGIGEPKELEQFLKHDKLRSEVERIQLIVQNSEKEKKVPFGGTHCFIVETAALDEDDSLYLFKQGIYDFGRHYQQARNVSLTRLDELINAGQYRDILWYAGNLEHRPDPIPIVLAVTGIFAARALIELGRLDAAHEKLQMTIKLPEEDGTPMPMEAAYTGMWFYIQRRDPAEAGRWAVLLAGQLVAIPGKLVAVPPLLYQISTHGVQMVPVLEQFNNELERLTGKAFPLPGWEIAGPPHLLYRGLPKNYGMATDEVSAAVKQIVEAIHGERDAAKADLLLDRLLMANPPGANALSKWLFSILQVRILTIDGNQRAIDAFFTAFGDKLIHELDFTSLSIVESELFFWAAGKGLSADLSGDFTSSCLYELIDVPFFRARFALLLSYTKDFSKEHSLFQAYRDGLELAEFYGLDMPGDHGAITGLDHLLRSSTLL